MVESAVMASTSTPILSLSSQFYRALLNVYPRPFREEYEHEMVVVFHVSIRATHRNGKPTAYGYSLVNS